MNPKQRTPGFLPVGENATLKEPGCGSLAMGTTRDVIIRGWVWWGEHFAKVLP
jgi:hypothetical protein